MPLADAFSIFRDKNPAFNISVIPPKNITTGTKMKPKFTKNSGILENVSVPDNKGGLNFETGYENEDGDNITVIITVIKFNFRQVLNEGDLYFDRMFGVVVGSALCQEVGCFLENDFGEVFVDVDLAKRCLPCAGLVDEALL